MTLFELQPSYSFDSKAFPDTGNRLLMLWRTTSGNQKPDSRFGGQVFCALKMKWHHANTLRCLNSELILPAVHAVLCCATIAMPFLMIKKSML